MTDETRARLKGVCMRLTNDAFGDPLSTGLAICLRSLKILAVQKTKISADTCSHLRRILMWACDDASIEDPRPLQARVTLILTFSLREKGAEANTSPGRRRLLWTQERVQRMERIKASYGCRDASHDRCWRFRYDTLAMVDYRRRQEWQAHGSASPRYGSSSSVAGWHVGLLHRSPVWCRRVVGDRASAANAVRWLRSSVVYARNAELSSGLRERGPSAYPRRTFLLPIYRIRQIRPSFESMTWRVPSLSVASPMGRYAALAG
jgi:hypothetical protein